MLLIRRNYLMIFRFQSFLAMENLPWEGMLLLIQWSGVSSFWVVDGVNDYIEEFCNNLISSSFCPRCGESIKECGSSRSVHYRRVRILFVRIWICENIHENALFILLQCNRLLTLIQYHFPIYYSLSQPLYKKEFIDQWLSVELGSRSTGISINKIRTQNS